MLEDIGCRGDLESGAGPSGESVNCRLMDGHGIERQGSLQWKRTGGEKRLTASA